VNTLPTTHADDAEVQPGTTLRLRLSDLRRLFNSMDPAPFRERDLDAAAAAYIIDWARETPAGPPLSLEVFVDGQVTSADQTRILQTAVGDFFMRRAAAKRREVRRLFRIGRISLVIGLVFVGAATAIAESLASVIPVERYARLVEESLVIGAWVALWRPMEIFLYDWWPMVKDARLYDRLSRVAVSVHAAAAGPQGAA
jgi:hypothetical protein